MLLGLELAANPNTPFLVDIISTLSSICTVTAADVYSGFSSVLTGDRAAPKCPVNLWRSVANCRDIGDKFFRAPCPILELVPLPMPDVDFVNIRWGFSFSGDDWIGILFWTSDFPPGLNPGIRVGLLFVIIYSLFMPGSRDRFTPLRLLSLVMAGVREGLMPMTFSSLFSCCILVGGTICFVAVEFLGLTGLTESAVGWPVWPRPLPILVWASF